MNRMFSLFEDNGEKIEIAITYLRIFWSGKFFLDSALNSLVKHYNSTLLVLRMVREFTKNSTVPTEQLIMK